MFWRDVFSSDSCDPNSQYSILFQGRASKVIEKLSSNSTVTSYLINQPDYKFQLEIGTSKKTLCGRSLTVTEQPNLLIFEKTNETNFFVTMKDDYIDFDLLTFSNSKFSVLEIHIRGEITDLYNIIEYNKCLDRQKIISNMLTLAYQSPESFAYNLHQGPGYTAIIRGEVVNVIKCSAVSVIIRKSDKCYQDIPVRLGDTEYYFKPRSRILTKHSSVVDCSNILPIKFKFDKNWFIVKDGFIKMTEPNKVEIAGHKDWRYNKTDLNALSPYTKEGAEQMLDLLSNEIWKDSWNDQLTSA